IVLWAIVLVVAAGARSPFGRRRTATVHDETLIDFDAEPSLAVAGEALAAWDDVDWADEPLEFADDPVGEQVAEPSPPSEPRATAPAPRAPLIIDRPVDPPDEPVDLAALVADVEAATQDEAPNAP